MYVHHAWDEKLKLSLGHEFCLNIIRVYYTWKWHGFRKFSLLWSRSAIDIKG